MVGPRIAVSATFTAEPLREPMAFLLRLLGWQEAIEFAPFAQIFQTLLDPAGLFARNAGGVNVLLARAEDFAGEGEAEKLTAAVESAAAHHRAELLIHVCASRSDSGELDLSGLSKLARVAVLSGEEQDRLYPVIETHDERARALGGIPYTSEYFAAMAAFLTRSIHRSRALPFKAIALDCDDTLWSGVCGEDGPANVVMDEPRFALQRFMKEQRRNGRLLAIASKNNAADVRETFQSHPEMPLAWEDFSARRIHWEGKAESLQSLAVELGLGLDSFVFVDDNPKETAEVAAELPQVAALSLPVDAGEIEEFLEHVWALDHAAAITAEDRDRSESYAREAERGNWERQARSLQEFIQGLELVVEISPLEERHLARAAQLTQRTNQMNFTTRRRSESEIQAFLESGWGWVVFARDRFGDYGLVGLMLGKEIGGELSLDTFLLSCRALGRGVEHRMMRHLGRWALERGLHRVIANFERTNRNAPAEELLKSIEDWSAQALAELVYRPSKSRPAVRAKLPASDGRSRQAADYQRIAELRRVPDLLRAMHESKRFESKQSAVHRARASEPPRTDLERHLCALWSELLAVPAIGVHDNFFDLGGHSLLAVQLVSRLHRDLAIELPLETVYTGTLTVAALARSIELHELEGIGESEYAAVLAEVESLSDEEAEALLAEEMKSQTQR